MGQYDRQIASVKRMIDKYGQSLTWRKQILVPVDDNKRWLGNTASPINYQPKVCFVPLSGNIFGLIELLKETEVPKGLDYGLMAPQDFEPDITDYVLRDGTPIELKSINNIRPAEQTLLHVLGFVK